MRYAVVLQDGKVENVVEWDGSVPYSPPGQLVPLAEDDVVAPGYSYIGRVFVPSAEPVQRPGRVDALIDVLVTKGIIAPSDVPAR